MTVQLNRRSLLAGGACLCCAGFTGVAEARIAPSGMTPLIGPDYRPQDKDEKGLWSQYQRIEADIAGSNLLIKDPKLTSYLGGIAEKVGGPAARDLRVYLAHVPEFNAFMAPTGFMVVFSGLLTRMRNEAQLAGVIAHEAGHFLRKHQLRAWRDMRTKTDILAAGSMALGAAGAAGGFAAGDYAQLAQLATIFSLAGYSRTLEAEADAMSVRQLADAGYSPVEASKVWGQLIAEFEQSARFRNKRARRGYSLLASHPAPADRLSDLRASAAEVQAAGRSYDEGRERYKAIIQPHLAMLLDDQVKLNDPGASLYIVNNLAKDGWNGPLRYSEAEIWRLRGRQKLGDEARAAAGYAAAVAYKDAPPEAWRAHGYALTKAGRREEGKRALERYLSLAPGAKDTAMVRYSIAS